MTAAEAPGYLPALRRPSRAVCKAAAVASSSRAAAKPGAATCPTGTGTIEIPGVGVGACGVVGVGDGLAATGVEPAADVDADGALPHAATAAASKMAAAAGPILRQMRRVRRSLSAVVTTPMMHQGAGSAPRAATAASRKPFPGGG